MRLTIKSQEVSKRVRYSLKVAPYKGSPCRNKESWREASERITRAKREALTGEKSFCARGILSVFPLRVKPPPLVPKGRLWDSANCGHEHRAKPWLYMQAQPLKGAASMMWRSFFSCIAKS